jgi:hypothetical protein
VVVASRSGVGGALGRAKAGLEIQLILPQGRLDDDLIAEFQIAFSLPSMKSGEEARPCRTPTRQQS